MPPWWITAPSALSRRLDLTDLLDGRLLEGQVVKARPFSRRGAVALAPEGEEEAAVAGQEGVFPAGRRGFAREVETERLTIEARGPCEVGDIEADVAHLEPGGGGGGHELLPWVVVMLPSK